MAGRIATVQQETFDYRSPGPDTGDSASEAEAASLRERPQLRTQVLGLCLCAFYGAFLVFGLSLLGLSAWLLGIRLWTCPVFAAYYAPLWLFLATGILLLVSGALGLMYVCFHNQQQSLVQHGTTALLALLVLSLCGLFGTLVLAAKYGNEAQARDTAQEVHSLFVQAKLDYTASLNSGGVQGGNIAIGSTASNVLLCWDSIQSTFACCGAESYTDWYSYRIGSLYYEIPLAPSVPSSATSAVSVNATIVNATAATATSSATSSVSSSPATPQAESVLIAPISCTCVNREQNQPQQRGLNSSGASSTCAVVNGPALNAAGQSPPYRVYGQSCIGPVKFAIQQHMTVMTAACPVVAALIVAHFVFACLLPRLSNQPDSRCIYSVNTGPHPTAYISQTNKRYNVPAFANSGMWHQSNATHPYTRDDAF